MLTATGNFPSYPTLTQMVAHTSVALITHIHPHKPTLTILAHATFDPPHAHAFSPRSRSLSPLALPRSLPPARASPLATSRSRFPVRYPPLALSPTNLTLNLPHPLSHAQSHPARPPCRPKTPLTHVASPPTPATHRITPEPTHPPAQLQNSFLAPSQSSHHQGREVSSSISKRAEMPVTTDNNRYHPYRAANSAAKKPHKDQASFPAGAGNSGPSACALCLGRFRHPIHKCTSEFLWDKRTKTRCRRNGEGHLVNPEGLELCYDWQRPKGCSNTARSHVHECSGCGGKDHGAQSCPQSESM